MWISGFFYGVSVLSKSFVLLMYCLLQLLITFNALDHVNEM